MRLYKVGSSPSCDIVVNNEYVSTHHADITVLDSGEVLIEDKGSRNGTFIGVNKKRLEPGQEYPITRGERVMLGNEPLRWDKIPGPTMHPKAKRVVNIGSSQRNDIVIPGNAVSRYHAVLVIDKDNKATITDNKSTNGTKVNGQKIMAGRPTPIKRGDNVIVGEEDITSRLEEYLPNNNGGKIALRIAAAILVLAVIGGGVWWAMNNLFSKQVNESAIVMVRNVYHYNIEPKDNPYKLPLHLESDKYAITGTGFFIDEEGRIGTARHVAMPWLEEYQEANAWTQLKIKDELEQAWNDMMNDIPTSLTYEEYESLSGTTNAFWKAVKSQGGDYRGVNTILRQLHQTTPEVTGESDIISIAYPNRHYTTFDEFSNAVFVAESGTKDKDVAIIQLNTKETPDKVMKGGIFDIANFHLTKPEIQKDVLQFTGFPEGLARTFDEHFKSSTNVPTTYQGKVSRNVDPFCFEIQANTTGGASGSPVYMGGKLYGVVSTVYKRGDGTGIVPAKWLKELYDNSVMPYRE